jgi:hypothetical protein
MLQEDTGGGGGGGGGGISNPRQKAPWVGGLPTSFHYRKSVQ